MVSCGTSYEKIRVLKHRISGALMLRILICKFLFHRFGESLACYYFSQAPK